MKNPYRWFLLFLAGVSFSCFADDLYARLDLDPEATDEQIGYALKFPDAKLEAFNVLSNPRARLLYDLTGIGISHWPAQGDDATSATYRLKEFSDAVRASDESNLPIRIQTRLAQLRQDLTDNQNDLTATLRANLPRPESQSRRPVRAQLRSVIPLPPPEERDHLSEIALVFFMQQEIARRFDSDVSTADLKKFEKLLENLPNPSPQLQVPNFIFGLGMETLVDVLLNHLTEANNEATYRRMSAALCLLVPGMKRTEFSRMKDFTRMGRLFASRFGGSSVRLYQTITVDELTRSSHPTNASRDRRTALQALLERLGKESAQINDSRHELYLAFFHLVQLAQASLPELTQEDAVALSNVVRLEVATFFGSLFRVEPRTVTLSGSVFNCSGNVAQAALGGFSIDLRAFDAFVSPEN